jgi:hypothetical protein
VRDHAGSPPRQRQPGAGKNREPRRIPVRRSLCDLYVDYLFAEYGELDSDYVLSRHPDNTYCVDPAVISMVRMDPLGGRVSMPFRSG